MSDKNHALEFLKGLLIGGAIGAFGALLYAPRSGKETREELGEKIEDLYQKAREEYEDSLKKARHSYESTLNHIKDLEIDARKRAEEVKNAAEDISEKGKEGLNQGRQRLEEAIHAAKDAFKDEIKNHKKTHQSKPADKISTKGPTDQNT